MVGRGSATSSTRSEPRKASASAGTLLAGGTSFGLGDQPQRYLLGRARVQVVDDRCYRRVVGPVEHLVDLLEVDGGVLLAVRQEAEREIVRVLVACSSRPRPVCRRGRRKYCYIALRQMTGDLR